MKKSDIENYYIRRLMKTNSEGGNSLRQFFNIFDYINLNLRYVKRFLGYHSFIK